MCVSFERAEFNGTSIGVFEVKQPEGRMVHSTYYQTDSPKSGERRYSGIKIRKSELEIGKWYKPFSDLRAEPDRSDSTSTGKALCLNIPAGSPLGPENFIHNPDVRTFDYLRGLLFPELSTFGGPVYRGSFRQEVRLFDHDEFTIAVAENPTDILSVVEKIAPNKRAAVNPELLEFYQKAYPDSQFAMAFYDSSQGAARLRIALQYAPLNPDEFFFPAVDNQDATGVHTGGAPKDIDVQRDHTLYWGFDGDGLTEGIGVSLPAYFRKSLAASEWLPQRVFGTEAYKSAVTGNGDFVISKGDARLYETWGVFTGRNTVVSGSNELTLLKPHFK